MRRAFAITAGALALAGSGPARADSSGRVDSTGVATVAAYAVTSGSTADGQSATFAVVAYSGVVATTGTMQVPDAVQLLVCRSTCELREPRVDSLAGQDDTVELIASDDELGQLVIRWRSIGTASWLSRHQAQSCGFWYEDDVLRSWRMGLDVNLAGDPLLDFTGEKKGVVDGSIGHYLLTTDDEAHPDGLTARAMLATSSLSWANSC